MNNEHKGTNTKPSITVKIAYETVEDPQDADLVVKVFIDSNEIAKIVEERIASAMNKAVSE